MVRKFILQLMTFLMILIISFSSVNNPITSGYIDELRQEAITVMKNDDPLYLEIDAKKMEYDVEAQDAVIDKVWKAIPGYNGLSVDVDASFKNMQPIGKFQEDRLVYNQVSPKVTLSDLDPSPIYRGHPDKPMVSLMVNVAWGNEYLPEILKVMKKYNVKSTFFLDGSWVKNNPKLAKMIVEEGHEIGNHAYSHPDMKRLSRERITDEIQRTNDIIEATVDKTPTWFAPPSGSYRQEVVDISRELDLYTVLWTVDTIDWKNPDPGQMASRVISKTEPGSLILMHPTGATMNGLEAMIQGISNKGYMIGTVSELLSETRITTLKQ